MDYCTDGSFGGCKLYNVISMEQGILVEETLANLWSFAKLASVSPTKVW